MSAVELYVPGDPPTNTAQQKGVDFKHRRIFTKPHIQAEKRRLARHLVGQIPPGGPLQGPLQCSIKVCFPLTTAQAEEHLERLADDEFELPHTGEPDADNSVKLVLDVLTTLRIWVDDAQICDLNIHKRYASRTGITIRVTPVADHH